MREQLLNGSEGLYISKSRTNKNQCMYSGDSIPKGVHGIRLRVKINGNSYGGWIAISSVDDLTVSLQHFTIEQFQLRDELSPTGNVKYNAVRGDNLRCCICDTPMSKSTKGISFHSPVGFASQTVWIHTHCRDTLVEGLENVWQYADDLLAEQI